MKPIIISIKEDGTVSLEAFSGIIDISKVKYYRLKEKDGKIEIKFYDSKHRRVRI